MFIAGVADLASDTTSPPPTLLLLQLGFQLELFEMFLLEMGHFGGRLADLGTAFGHDDDSVENGVSSQAPVSSRTGNSGLG